MTEVFISASLQHANDGSFMHGEMNSKIFRLLAAQFKTGGVAWINGFEMGALRIYTHTNMCNVFHITFQIMCYAMCFRVKRSLVGFYQASVPEVRSHSFSSAKSLRSEGNLGSAAARGRKSKINK